MNIEVFENGRCAYTLGLNYMPATAAKLINAIPLLGCKRYDDNSALIAFFLS
jgi:hypothetical protein